MRKKLSIEDRERALDMLSRGASQKDVGQLLRCSQPTISRLVARNRFLMARGLPPDAPVSEKERRPRPVSEDMMEDMMEDDWLS